MGQPGIRAYSGVEMVRTSFASTHSVIRRLGILSDISVCCLQVGITASAVSHLSEFIITNSNRRHPEDDGSSPVMLIIWIHIDYVYRYGTFFLCDSSRGVARVICRERLRECKICARSPRGHKWHRGIRMHCTASRPLDFVVPNQPARSPHHITLPRRS